MVTAIALFAIVASLVVVIQFVINLSRASLASLYLSWHSMAPGNPFSLLWDAIMASFSVDQSHLMTNANDTIHCLEHYVTGALTRTISDVYLIVTEIRTIVTLDATYYVSRLTSNTILRADVKVEWNWQSKQNWWKFFQNRSRRWNRNLKLHHKRSMPQTGPSSKP
ncbi:hypothetical protein JB92DRAFT_3117408 [Gautieria morchelliformis]|nr:hypothetical protein JB92DRAFT_3117408 [Gautieria morchelliformis]